MDNEQNPVNEALDKLAKASALDNPTQLRRHNWAAAYSAYYRGAPLQEIADTMKIPMVTLTMVARVEKWEKLREATSLSYAQASVTIPTDKDAEEKWAKRARHQLERIIANREENLVIAERLRQDLANCVQKLLEGTLTQVKVSVTKKGEVVEHEIPATIKDRLDLANYAKLVAEISYAALGDKAVGGEKVNHGLSAGEAAAVPGITIVLPGAIAEPRNARVVDLSTPERAREALKPQAQPVTIDIPNQTLEALRK